jgi:hypothetical protein
MALGILMQLDDAASVFLGGCRDEGYPRPATGNDLVTPLAYVVREKKVVMGETLLDVDQFFSNDLKRVWRGAIGPPWSPTDLQMVSKEGDCGSPRLAQVIHRFWGHNHLGLEGDSIGRFVPDPMKQSANVAVVPGFIPNMLGRLQQRAVSRQTQKADGVKEVRLPHAVRSRNASEGSESNVHAHEVLETLDFEPC